MSLKSNFGTFIDRAINELRTGRPIVIKENKNYWMFFNIEHSDNKILNQFNQYLQKDKYLLITKQKAKSIFENKISTNIYLKINEKISNKSLLSLFINPLSDQNKILFKDEPYIKSKDFHNVCLDIAKNAKVIPSLIFKKINSKYYKNIDNLILQLGLLRFNHKELKNQNKFITNSIRLVSSANVPLPNVASTTFNIFKSYIGARRHIAIIIKPKNLKQPTNLRIHSACFTGDIFHSRKCDCGEQLNNSLNYMVKNKGGIILYLDQEGRGIGLANKMRAYSLQSKGLDTIDADHNIGFLDDERDFNIAAKILKLLKVNKVNIITNNFTKVSSLKKAGIKIAKQINTKPTINKFNNKILFFFSIKTTIVSLAFFFKNFPTNRTFFTNSFFCYDICAYFNV